MGRTLLGHPPPRTTTIRERLVARINPEATAGGAVTGDWFVASAGVYAVPVPESPGG